MVYIGWRSKTKDPLLPNRVNKFVFFHGIETEHFPLQKSLIVRLLIVTLQ